MCATTRQRAGIHVHAWIRANRCAGVPFLCHGRPPSKIFDSEHRHECAAHQSNVAGLSPAHSFDAAHFFLQEKSFAARMLWAARQIARLTGATEGGAYQMLERSLERAGL